MHIPSKANIRTLPVSETNRQGRNALLVTPCARDTDDSRAASLCLDKTDSSRMQPLNLTPSRFLSAQGDKPSRAIRRMAATPSPLRLARPDQTAPFLICCPGYETHAHTRSACLPATDTRASLTQVLRSRLGLLGAAIRTTPSVSQAAPRGGPARMMLCAQVLAISRY